MALPQKISCFSPIPLQRNYRILVTTTPQPNICSNLLFALVQAFVELDERGGSLKDSLFDFVQSVCPTATEEAVQAAFDLGLRKGIIMTVVPSYINYLVAMPPNRYVLSVSMDTLRSNQPYVIFLIQLIGGFASPQFIKWFVPYNAPTSANFSLEGCTVCP